MLLFSIQIDFNFSLFTLVIFGLIAWGGYRGYKRGGIIMALSVFALAGGLGVSAALGMITYKYFIKVSAVPEVFGSIILGLSFLGAIWFSAFVQKAVHVRVKDVASDKTNNIVGALFGVGKFFVIAAVYSTVILNLNCRGQFLPERDVNCKTMSFSKKFLETSVKMVRMDKHYPDTDPCSPVYKKNHQLQQQQQNPQQNQDNNTNTQPVNNTQTPVNPQQNNNQTNTNNQQNPIVEDVDNP